MWNIERADLLQDLGILGTFRLVWHSEYALAASEICSLRILVTVQAVKILRSSLCKNMADGRFPEPVSPTRSTGSLNRGARATRVNSRRRIVLIQMTSDGVGKGISSSEVTSTSGFGDHTSSHRQFSCSSPG